MRSALRFVIPALLLALAGALLFARAMDRGLNHDEHQFLAPAALVSRQGLRPYIDFPVFHVPNLIYLYAGIDRLGVPLLFGAKCVGVLASLSVAGLLAMRCLSDREVANQRVATAMAVSSVVIFLFDPLFVRTAGKTWNHELPACFAVLAFYLHIGAARKKSLRFAFASGVLLSLAIGTRLTWLPVALPFLGAIFIFPECDRGRKMRLAGAFAVGGIVGGLPTLLSFYADPAAFWFNNYQFPRIRLLDPTDIRAHETAAWWRKIRFFFKEIVRLDFQKDRTVTGSLPTMIAFAVAIWVSIACRFNRQNAAGKSQATFPILFLLLVVPFIALGCALPTRYQYQHWFGLMPFLVVGIVEGWRFTSGSEKPARWLSVLIAGVAATNLALTIREYSPIRFVAKPDEWFTSKFRKEAILMRPQIAGGKLLTLAPIWPIETGLPIYSAFATGPFAWRLAHLVPSSERQKYHLVSPEDLARALANDQPAGILTGVEDDNEEAGLIEWAKANHYRKLRLAKKRRLWLPPEN